MQLQDLRRYVARFGRSREYVEIGVSGAQRRRPQLDALMMDARKRLFDVVLVWKFDRFARSVKNLVDSLEEFRALGAVRLHLCGIGIVLITAGPPLHWFYRHEFLRIVARPMTQTPIFAFSGCAPIRATPDVFFHAKDCSCPTSKLVRGARVM